MLMGIVYHTNGMNKITSWLLNTCSFLQDFNVYPKKLRKIIDSKIFNCSSRNIITVMTISIKRQAIIKINDANVDDIISKRGLFIVCMKEKKVLSIPPIKAFGKAFCDVSYTPTYNDIVVSLSKFNHQPVQIALIKSSL